MQTKKISYLVGTSSFTKQMNINEEENVDFINKQLSLSIPLITGVKIEDKKQVKQIFVGKEISLDHINENNYWLQKYDIALEELTDILLQGFKRACILNFKNDISLSFSLIVSFKALTLKLSASLFSVSVLILLFLSFSCS